MKCEDCVYCRLEIYEFEIDFPIDDKYLCHRYPPVPTYQGGGCVWDCRPSVDLDDFCGEFKRKGE